MLRHPKLAGLVLGLSLVACAREAPRSTAIDAAPAGAQAPSPGPDAAPPERAAQMTAELREGMSPDDVYQAFKDGHERFLSGNLRYRRLTLEVEESALEQHPYAIVLSCIDSRVHSETIFDKRIGDIFSARTAGNIVNEDTLGGMEFATQLAGAKLVMVMGHTRCGAVQGAVADAKLGHLTGLLERIKPAVKRTAETFQGKADPKDYAFVDAVATENVRLVKDQIRERSPVLRKLEAEGKIKIVGAMYDLKTGKVTFEP